MTGFRDAFPITSVGDVDRAVDFHCSTFGFETTYSFEEEGTTAFAFLRLERLGIGIARRSAPDVPECALWVYADDLEEAVETLRGAGAEELLAPTDQPWGERTCTFRSPEGHVIDVGMRR